MVNILTDQRHTLLGCISVLIWSFAALMAVGLTSVPTFELLACGFSFAFLINCTRYYFSDEKQVNLSFKMQDLVIASIALFLNQGCYYAAFRYAPAAQVDLINYLWPSLLVLFSSLLPKEKFCFSYLAACVVCIWGVYNLVSPGSMDQFTFENGIGYLSALGAALTWASYSLYTRYRGSKSSNCVSWACGPAAVISLILHLSFEKFVMPSTAQFALILTLGVFQMGLAFYFWEKALKKGSVKFLGLAAYAIPVFSVMILVIFGVADFEERMILATLIITVAPLIPFFKKRYDSGDYIQHAH